MKQFLFDGRKFWKKVIFDLIFDLFDTHENPGSIFRFMSDFGFLKNPYLLVWTGAENTSETSPIF